MQFEKAVYHVINRGNYRRDLFESAGAAQAFVDTLEETSKAYGWIIYAYVLMRNHFHVVLQTPQANLSEGMHWLQSTFATRFNRYRQERGHLFQGRYYAGLLEDMQTLAHVVDYVHLNPVSARIIEVNQVGAFRWSSLGRFLRGPRFERMNAEDWLGPRALSDRKEDWECYLLELRELWGNLEEQKRLGWDKFGHGMAHGSEAWKAALHKEHAQMKLDPSMEASELREIRESRWMSLLQSALDVAGRSVSDLEQGRKTQAWKVKIAVALRTEHGVASKWLAETLHLGSPGSTRNLLSRIKRDSL